MYSAFKAIIETNNMETKYYRIKFVLQKEKKNLLISAPETSYIDTV